GDPIVLPRDSPVLRLVQRIRDEAHRFAISYHRTLRDKRTFGTELTSIPGVGSTIARRLLRRFGSVEAVRAADARELEGAVGAQLAATIRAHLALAAAGVPHESTGSADRAAEPVGGAGQARRPDEPQPPAGDTAGRSGATDGAVAENRTDRDGRPGA